MALTLQFEVDGERQLSRTLGIAADGIEDFTEPLTESSESILSATDQNFEQSGGLFGGWAARKNSYPWPILQKTGAMRGGFAAAIDSTQLEIGNETDYFPYHQGGTVHLPKRVMLKLDEQRKQSVVKAFQKYIVKVMRGRRGI